MRYERLSISVGAGNVLSVTQEAKSLSDALDQEISYYQRAGRVPAEIDINKEK